MKKEFINSINRKIIKLRKESLNFDRHELIEKIPSNNVSKNSDEIQDYQIGFYILFENNSKLDIKIESLINNLINQDYFRQDISNGVSVSIRELRLPEDQKSEWQLLYETLIYQTNESGPIMHLYFDGWDLINSKVYYFEEAYLNDITVQEEVLQFKKILLESGFQIDDALDNEGILKLKKYLNKDLKNRLQ
jgi:hypothetical protein